MIRFSLDCFQRFEELTDDQWDEMFDKLERELSLRVCALYLGTLDSIAPPHNWEDCVRSGISRSSVKRHFVRGPQQ